MTQVGPLTALSDRWRYALLGGLVALPFTAASYWQTGSDLSLNAVFWGGLLAGYLIKRRGLASTPVGVRVGVIGALPALGVAANMLPFVLGHGGPVWFRLVRVAMAAAVTLLLVLVAAVFGALVGAVGARLGGWLAERGGHPRDSVTGTA